MTPLTWCALALSLLGAAMLVLGYGAAGAGIAVVAIGISIAVNEHLGSSHHAGT